MIKIMYHVYVETNQPDTRNNHERCGRKRIVATRYATGVTTLLLPEGETVASIDRVHFSMVSSCRKKAGGCVRRTMLAGEGQPFQIAPHGGRPVVAEREDLSRKTTARKTREGPRRRAPLLASRCPAREQRPQAASSLALGWRVVGCFRHAARPPRGSQRR